MPHAYSAGAQIGWTEEGAGDPILLIMGHLYGKEMWHRTIPALAAQHRVISFDNRGVGSTSAPRGPLTIETMASDAIAVLDAAGVGSAHVFGVSMGGLIAQELAISHPDRVRSLILGCTGAPTDETSPEPRWLGLKYRIPLGLTSRLTAGLMYAKGTSKDTIREDLAIIAATPYSSGGLAQQARAIARYRSLERLGAVSTPTLVIHGTEDRVVPIELGREMAARIAGSRFVEVPGAGHNFIADRTDETNDLVLDFLQQVGRESTAVPSPT